MLPVKVSWGKRLDENLVEDALSAIDEAADLAGELEGLLEARARQATIPAAMALAVEILRTRIDLAAELLWRQMRLKRRAQPARKRRRVAC